MSIWEKDVIENVSIIKTFHGYVLRTFKYDTYFTSQMNLFKNLRTNYGQGTIKIVRKAENTTCQIARHRNHLVFNLRCKGECVIPPSLRLKCPINSDKARNIVEKARKNLLQKRIRLTNQKISHLQDKKRRLAERFPSDVQQQLNARLTRVHESVRKQTKCRQQDKLASLISKSVKNKHSEPDLSGTQIKRWVVNLSKYKLKQDQTRPVLSKGLNFAITPHCIPTNDILVATEMACKSLPTNEATQLRTEIVGAIKSSKVPKSNISRAEKNGPSVNETGGFHHDTTSRQGKSHSSHG